MCGFIAQLVEHRTGIAEVKRSNPVEALIFFRLLLSNCLKWYYDQILDTHFFTFSYTISIYYEQYNSFFWTFISENLRPPLIFLVPSLG